MSQKSGSDAVKAAFGANQWLVDELYEKYLADPASVDPAWWDFFADYRPRTDLGTPTAAAPSVTEPSGGSNGVATAAPAAAAKPAAGEEPSGAAATQAAPAAPPQQAPTTQDESPAPAARTERSAEQTLPRTPREPVSTLTGPIAAAQPATALYAYPPAARVEHPSAREAETVDRLRGPAARVVANMESSLEVPTATSVRAVPAKLMVDNRTVINNHLARTRGGKISFTHLIGYAIVEALADMPAMNQGYLLVDGKPAVVSPGHVNLGLAIDLAKPDGTRQLLVPSIKRSDTLDFGQFVAAYEEVVRKARAGKLTVEDFSGTTITLTNPGTIGTVHSVPRLMAGQGTIVGVGAMDYPAEFQGASDEQLARLGISKVLTLTSTYDHRIIQGAQSGDFLRIISAKLLGDGGFYDRVFTSLRIPYEPVRWVRDNTVDADTELAKPARIAELIHSYRSRGHLMAETDPLAYRQRKHPDLDIQNHGLTLWDLDRVFPSAGFTGKPKATLREILGLLRDSYCRTIGAEYMHLQDPRQRRWLQERLEAGYARTPREDQLRILRRLNAAEAFETFLQTKFVGQKRFSLEG
ncbi:2-oxo acid dehydrogenase subunit E2, partial [Actinotalea sp.]|uniref:2-oxo acid dehydrogenase subunit E2 n=1 Tax=Actinotalea sp. TaxID=1872145 RepID=UPI003566649E